MDDLEREREEMLDLLQELARLKSIKDQPREDDSEHKTAKEQAWQLTRDLLQRHGRLR